MREKIALALMLAGGVILLAPALDSPNLPGTFDIHWMLGAYALLLLGGALFPKDS